MTPKNMSFRIIIFYFLFKINLKFYLNVYILVGLDNFMHEESIIK